MARNLVWNDHYGFVVLVHRSGETERERERERERGIYIVLSHFIQNHPVSISYTQIFKEANTSTRLVIKNIHLVPQSLPISCPSEANTFGFFS
jgi:hypothetical protein